MGTQQLFLIIVGMILIGIMITIGIFMFRDQSAATNRDQLSNDLVNLAAQAQKYYRKPGILGGGSYSYGGLTLGNLTGNPTNVDGTFVMTPDPVPLGTKSISITGTGTETGNDAATPVSMTMTLWADSLFMVSTN